MNNTEVIAKLCHVIDLQNEIREKRSGGRSWPPVPFLRRSSANH